MSDDALDLSVALVGSLPIRPTTLQNFVYLSLQPDTQKTDLVAVIERDPALLVGALDLVPPGTSSEPWHQHLDESLLRCLAIVWANTHLLANRTPAAGETEAQAGPVSLALRLSLLADALGGQDSACRIAGLFTGAVTDWASNPVAVADLLAQTSLPLDIRDAVRYSDTPLEQLTGLAWTIRVTAAARALLPHMDHGGALPEDLVASACGILGFDSDRLYTAMGRATREVQAACKPLDETLPSMVLGANIGNALYRARALAADPHDISKSLSSLRQIGRLMLGADSLYRFVERSGSLVCEEHDFTAEISLAQSASAVAVAKRTGTPQALAAGDAREIVDRQLLDRLGDAPCLLTIPLGQDAGVIACSVSAHARDDLLANGGSLRAFANLATQLCLADDVSPASEETRISLATLDQEIREITHEVNNPLTTVRNYLATLSLKLGQDAGVESELGAITSELARIGRIVQKYARIGREEQLVYEVVDLNSVIRDLVGVMSEGSNVNFNCQLDQSLPQLEFAADAISQVIMNLLKNASEALSGRDDAEVVIATQGAINVGGRAYTEVTVTDNGPGMTAETRLALFEPNASTKGEGRGLGLTIVRQLMEAMNGIVSCRDAPGGGGTSFQLLIPIGSPPRRPGA